MMTAAQQPSESSSRQHDADTRAVARQLSERLGLVVTLSPRGKGGRLSIQYSDLDQLEGVIRLLQA